MRMLRARISAPAVHACLFLVAYAYWLLFERNAHHPGRLDLITIVWIADLPISALASFMTLGIGFVAGIGRAQVAFGFICGPSSERYGGISWASLSKLGFDVSQGRQEQCVD